MPDDEVFEDGWEDDEPSGPEPDHERSRNPRVIWIAGGAVLVVAVIIVAVVLSRSSKNTSSSTSSTTTAPGGKTTKTSNKLAWPGAVAGRPVEFGKRGDGPDKAKALAAPGVYIWNDFDGWHVWVVKGAGTEKVKVQVASDKPLVGATVVGTAPTGLVKTPDRVTFDFSTTTAHVSGLNINLGFFGKSVIISVDGGSGPLDTKLIFRGSKRVPATTNPDVEQKLPA
ncbi:MAG: hypothetical protein JWN46_233 [Acidimicrobiales bacterium]|nr:hypothetical protein [Acidimicrobiales bacterium]